TIINGGYIEALMNKNLEIKNIKIHFDMINFSQFYTKFVLQNLNYEQFFNNPVQFYELNLFSKSQQQINFDYLVLDNNKINSFYSKNLVNFNEENFTSKIENFKESFRTFIDELYKEKFSPEDILGYIYAVLFHKIYREKYLDFLKIDFPKIPFTKDKNTFKNLSKLGLKLINLHLLKNDELDFNVGEALFKDIKNKNLKIQKIKYNKDTKELFINESLYFTKVSLEIYEFKIGGYAVLDKYLKSHKEEDIDHKHFTLIIQTLNETLKIQDEISKINLS
ncbi:TPA: hypothetical protein RTH99_001689, partial [Campylobacter jejuni]|nr:hypothetical protein [Campylobacter jejuni]